ncbi:MAG: peptidoglycan DD-metalloendopeptidase family protein [Candidatus Jorgensenbacteria bacterium]|nr:peptidoglycan DD-metalloendopeptidase family protein [Candidatus Jorgensenbacteria bacterium]
MNTQKTIFIIAVFCFSIGFVGGAFLRAQTADAQIASNNPDVSRVIAAATEEQILKQKIEEKNATLQNIQNQREILQQNLDEVAKSQDSLKKEIRTIDSNVNQLNLSVRESAVTVEKLGLEVNTLAQGITDAQASIVRKREAVQKLLVELQERERMGMLGILLAQTTLGDHLAEIQQITSLNDGLRNGITDLQNLQSDIKNKIESTKIKQGELRVKSTSLENQKILVQEQKSEKQRVLEATKNREDLYQQQLTALEKMQEEISSEVEAIEYELRKKIDPDLIPIARKIFLWPVLGGHKTQGYGFTTFAQRAYKGGRHNGLDIGGVPIGTEVFAAETGKIISVGDQDKYCRKGAYGKYVMVKHNNGLTTLYGHLSKYIVAPGQIVERGQVIGYIGSTGYATGPHLHLTIFANSTLPPSRPGYPEGTQPSRSCGPMPIGGDLNPEPYFL